MSRIIFVISFFIYGGYYVGLAGIFAFNLGSLSRYYSQPLRILMAILMLYVIHKHRMTLAYHNLSRYIVLFIIFWAFYVVKVLITANNVMAIELEHVWYDYILYPIMYVIIPFITFCSLDIRKYWLNIISGFIFAGFTLGLASIYLYGSFMIGGIGRINAISYQTGEAVLNPLSMAYTGVLTILLCLYRLIIYKKNTKFQVIYFTITMILCFVLFLFGASRGSVVALFLSLPLFFYYSPLKHKVKLTFLSFILFPILIWIIEASGSDLFNRVDNTSEDKGGGRTTLWENAFDHFLEHPIFGGRVEIGHIYPHNFIIEILMSTGIIGALLILPVVFKGFSLGFWSVKKNKLNLFALLMLFVGFVLYTFSSGLYTTILLFVPIGILFSQAHYNALED